MAEVIINPYAVLKALEDQYNYGLGTGISDPAYYARLQGEADGYVQMWEQELAQGTGIRGMGTDAATGLINQARDLSRRLVGAQENANLVQYSQSRDRYLTENGVGVDQLTESIERMLNEGMSLEEAVKIMMETGQYSLEEVQRVAFNVGNPDYDPAAGGVPGSAQGGETPLPDAGGDDFKPFEPVANDLTTPQEEFQKAFAQFTRQLETSQTGKAPILSALSERYQDLFNKYLGEIEARKSRGEEAEDVFKEKFVNIGKSADPQFDQETDRMQLTTVRPTLSAFDFLLNNVDPEDVYASTPFEQRPGRTNTGGFRGFVRRLNR